MSKWTSKDQYVLYPCTNSGYGIGSEGIYCDENSPLNPISLYGKVKVKAEKQLLDTIRIHFKNIEEVVILRLSSRGLKPNLKWEMSRNNDLFPHYYGDISFDNIIDLKKIKVNKKINELFANKIF